MPTYIPTPATNVMLDIETYGLTPGSVIKSIGAVKFGFDSHGTPTIFERFYRRIDVQSCVAAGLTLDGATVEWWLAQSDEARKEMILPGENLSAVLHAFGQWVNDDNAEIWGNGAAYDNVLVACAGAAVGLPMPWAHRRSLCYRTMKNTNRDVPFEPFKVGTHHNALDDAESQARHLMAIWQKQEKQARALALLRTPFTNYAAWDAERESIIEAFPS